MRDAPPQETTRQPWEDEEEEDDDRIRHGCLAWVHLDELDPGRFCLLPMSPGDRLCNTHRRLFNEYPQAEQFLWLSPGSRQMLLDIESGRQVRLFPRLHFRRARNIRSWVAELEQLFQAQPTWEIQEATDRFNQDNLTSFRKRQVAQGLKILCDRGQVVRSRTTVKGDRMTLYTLV